MFNFQAVTPVVIYALHVFCEHRTVIDTRLFRIMKFFGVTDPMRMLRSVILQQIMGVEYQYHCRQFYPEIRSWFSSYCSLYGVDKITETVSSITNGMASWKLAMIQASVIRIRCHHLLETKGKIVADIDVTTIQSSSSKKKGAEAGYNKKNKGNPVFSYRRPLSENFSSMRSCFRVSPIRVIFSGKPSEESYPSVFTLKLSGPTVHI